MMKREVAFIGDAISDEALEFGAKGKHRAEDFAEGRQIVVGDPAAEAEEESVQNRGWIEDVDYIFRGDIRFAVVEFDDDARQALLAEGDEDASADDWHEGLGDTVGEDHVQRHRQGYVAEFGHCSGRINQWSVWTFAVG